MTVESFQEVMLSSAKKKFVKNKIKKKLILNYSSKPGVGRSKKERLCALKTYLR